MSVPREDCDFFPSLPYTPTQPAPCPERRSADDEPKGPMWPLGVLLFLAIILKSNLDKVYTIKYTLSQMENERRLYV